jgi:hypothetical protein
MAEAAPKVPTRQLEGFVNKWKIWIRQGSMQKGLSL